MLYHDIELEVTRAMHDDASQSICFFSMPNNPEYMEYTKNMQENVDIIVKKVIERINRS